MIVLAYLWLRVVDSGIALRHSMFDIHQQSQCYALNGRVEYRQFNTVGTSKSKNQA
jgi:hypothetical protein